MYKIGADVFCTDTQIGKLIKVVVDPHTRRITDLVVEKGVVHKHDRVIPIEAVEKVTDEGIYLSISSNELSNYPEYREVEFTISDPTLLEEMGYKHGEMIQWTWRYGEPVTLAEPIRPKIRQKVHMGISPDEQVIGRGTRVHNAVETIGYVDHLLVNDETGEITHIVVRRGILPYRIVIPMSMVKDITDEGIYVPATRDELKKLSRFTPRADADILAEVQQKMAESTEHDLSNVKVSIIDGVIHLAGTVANVLGKRKAHEIAQEVEGVVGVENRITTDVEVEARVVSALLSDPRTEMATIDVAVDRGIVTLSGIVESQKIKQAAEEIARRQPGVINVMNEIEVNPEAKKLRENEYQPPMYVAAGFPREP